VEFGNNSGDLITRLFARLEWDLCRVVDECDTISGAKHGISGGCTIKPCDSPVSVVHGGICRS